MDEKSKNSAYKKLYFWKIFFSSMILMPLVLTVIAIAGIWTLDYLSSSSNMSILFIVGIPLAMIVAYLFWKKFVGIADFPESAFERYLPFAVVFAYHLVIWIISFIISNYSYTTNFGNTIAWSSLPYFIFNLFFSMDNSYPLMLIFPCAVNIISVALFTLACARKNKKPVNLKGAIILPAAVLVLAGIICLQFYYRSTLYVSPPPGSYTVAEKVKDDIELQDYLPFTNGSRLEKFFDGTPNLIISSDYPKLDGATAAYPVYAAIAQAMFDGLGVNSIDHFVMCSKTDGAYERLINGEVDIIFVAQPSKQQTEMAKEKGSELNLTPIAKEAFVFTVNSSNPVESLTVKQIQDIYTRKITNWGKVGGNDEKIIAFQRPENSGSQTVMLAAVMNGRKLPEPLREEYSMSMGGLITQVADYANYSASIGYSFRFFATEMNKDVNIKLLSVDGVAPTPENITNGTYPFTVDVYAVTAGSTNKNIQPLLEWILSEQGQNFIEQCGYVKLK